MVFDYFIFFQALEVRDAFFAQLFSSSANRSSRLRKTVSPVFDVALGVRVGFVPFMEIGCINPLLAAR